MNLEDNINNNNFIQKDKKLNNKEKEIEKRIWINLAKINQRIKRKYEMKNQLITKNLNF